MEISRSLLFLCFFIAYHHNIAAQVMQFYGEKIEFTVHEGYATVRGHYYFVNPSDETAHHKLFYPFVCNEDLPLPDSVRVYRMPEGEITPVEWHHNGVSYKISFPPGDTLSNEVFYLQ